MPANSVYHLIPSTVKNTLIHSGYVGALAGASTILNEWQDHTITGLFADVSKNWDRAGGNTLYAFLTAIGVVAAVNVKRHSDVVKQTAAAQGDGSVEPAEKIVP